MIFLNASFGCRGVQLIHRLLRQTVDKRKDRHDFSQAIARGFIGPSKRDRLLRRSRHARQSVRRLRSARKRCSVLAHSPAWPLQRPCSPRLEELLHPFTPLASSASTRLPLLRRRAGPAARARRSRRSIASIPSAQPRRPWRRRRIRWPVAAQRTPPRRSPRRQPRRREEREGKREGKRRMEEGRWKIEGRPLWHPSACEG